MRRRRRALPRQLQPVHAHLRCRPRRDAPPRAPAAAGDAGRDAAVPAPADCGSSARERGAQRRRRTPTRSCGDSRYARMYRLALDWTAGAGDAPTTRVKAVEATSRRTTSTPSGCPRAPIPLDGFLFEDRRGYCQQFSGAMALMLRMLGIPARVAAGFSPGSYNRDTREYRVRDLDAHSWVEVYFTGIGWVPFDPTPTASPAESQSGGLGGHERGARRRGRGAPTPRAGVAASERGDRHAAGSVGDDGGVGLGRAGARAAGAGRLGGAARDAVRRVRVRRDLDPRAARGGAARRAAPRARRGSSWELPAATTLLGLERRLAARRARARPATRAGCARTATTRARLRRPARPSAARCGAS